MVGAAALLALLGGFFAIRSLAPPVHGDGVSQEAAVHPNPVAVVGPTETPVCALSLSNPTEADHIPDYGPLNVSWSGVPGAASYALKVIPPHDVSVPWAFPTQGTTRTIYMENFAAGGDYEFSVDALDANGGVLCATELRFKKSAYVPPAGRQDESGGGGAGGCNPNGMAVFCP